MKPSLNMDTAKIVMEAPEKKSRTISIKWAVIGLVTVIVVALIVSLSVYFGMKATKDTYKAAWQTFKSQDGARVEEKVTVKDDSVDIKVPNEMEVVYDYKRGLKVLRFVNHQTGLYGPCYASYINDSMADSPDDVRNNLEDGREYDLGEETSVTTTRVRFTDRKVLPYMLSEEVKRMCHDTDVYWTENDPNSNKEKRQTSCAYVRVTRYCLHYRRYSICQICVICYNANGKNLGYQCRRVIYRKP